MKRISLPYLYLFIFSFLAACGIKQPLEIENESRETARIFVNSEPAGAHIFLDNENVFKITPDTLHDVTPGTHVIKVFKDGFKSINDSLTVNVEKDSLLPVNFSLRKLLDISKTFVQTTPAGAEIFLNGSSTGKTTPDTLQLESGSHEISAVKNGYLQKMWTIETTLDSVINLNHKLEIQNRVLLESFANISCIPCAPATENLLNFAANSDPASYAIIEYFAFWPSPNDPFYKAASDDVDKRLYYYNVATLPTLKIAGSDGTDPADYSAIENRFQSELAGLTHPLGLSVEKSKTGNTLSVSVEIYDFEDVLLNDQLRLFVAVIENEIHFDSAPGSNGLKDFEYVFRGFLNSREGDSINNSSNPVVFSFESDWLCWDYEHTNVIAFIQDINSRQIIQSSIN